MDKKKVVYTGRIPQCPNCDKPIMRTGGVTTTTCIYFPPRYDENGVNTNPDRNKSTSSWYCEECKEPYTVTGNYVEGFFYEPKTN